MQISKYLFTRIIFSLFVCCWVISAESAPSALGILPPTGKYIVGYREYAWINENECPDPYFKNNKNYYSPNNSKHCREVISTVYYPAREKTIHYSPYYRPAIAGWEQEFAKLPNNVRPIVHMREQVFIHAGKELPPILNERFPVVLFAPGFDVNGNEYSNLLINLASHGYIVFVINNTYIGDIIELPNGQIVKHQAKWVPKAWNTAETDILYVRNKLKSLQNNSGLLPPMNLKQVGLLGHSMGAMLTVDLAHKKPQLFQAAVALDASYEPQWSDPHSKFKIPFLHIHAADWATRMPRKYSGFPLSKNEYFVTLSPDKNQENYTHHMIFSDFSTLQYLPEVQKLLAYYHIVDPKKDVLDIGIADGKKVQLTISNYLIIFFDRYLKNKLDVRIDQCQVLSKDTRLVCGPGNISNTGERR